MSKEITIGLASALLGVCTSTLRKWESRYGFPQPIRCPNGKRVYNLEQFHLLKYALKLINNGEKPSFLFSSNGAKLKQKIIDDTVINNQLFSQDRTEQIDAIYNKLLKNDIQGCRTEFQQLHNEQNHIEIIELIENLLTPLLVKVGNAWLSGELEVYQEHLISDLIQTLLKDIIYNLANKNKITILLCTPSKEFHSLSLSMVEYAFKSIGANCINLGASLPADELVKAAKNYNCQIIAISSSNFLKRNIINDYLKTVRILLPSTVQLWVGGNCLENISKPIEGIKYFINLQLALDELKSQISVINSC